MVRLKRYSLLLLCIARYSAMAAMVQNYLAHYAVSTVITIYTNITANNDKKGLEWKLKGLRKMGNAD